MIKNKTIFKHMLGWMSALAILIISPLGFAQEPVTVRVTAMRSADNIQYSYQVSNHTSSRNIVSVSIGGRGRQPDGSYPHPDLTIYPLGSYWERMPDQGDSQNVTLRLGGIYVSPPGWHGGIMAYAETTNFSVDWNLDLDGVKNFPVIYPGQTLNFGVTVPTLDGDHSAYTMSDPAYLTAYSNGHFTVRFDGNEEPETYTGTIVPIDTTPPSLTVSLSPNTLWPPNGKLVPITATITVQDDYDPSPEIQPESVTANEPFDEEEDVQGGADDRQFSLAAKRAGTNPAGRIYHVTYSATDASGNKATASATVTVPHDQGK